MDQKKKEFSIDGSSVAENSELSLGSTRTSEIEDSGLLDISRGDIICFPGHGFGFVYEVKKRLLQKRRIVTFSTVVYDYTNEGGGMDISEPITMIMLPSEIISQCPSDIQRQEFIEHLNAKNLTFDYESGRIINKTISRVNVGSTYYYIDTDMAERSAIDDGASTGIHHARFLQGNYFKNMSRATLLGREVRNALKGCAIPNGNWT